MRPILCVTLGVVFIAAATAAPAGESHPYDLSAVDALLAAEASSLSGHYAIIVRQDGTEIYRTQLGDIGFDTKLGMASLTKTVSAAVVLQSVDVGTLAIDDTLGSLLPAFAAQGLGAPSVADCFGMRHGITAPASYELLPLTLAQSALAIAANGTQSFTPGTALQYDGNGMQVVGFACQSIAGMPWEALAIERVLAPCGMRNTDYQQFAPNPAIAGGLRSSCTEIDRFGSMVMAGGRAGRRTVLSTAAIDRLFTNATDGLPVVSAPFPESHPLYPYGQPPDYGFGAWVIAHNPVTDEVEEILGAGFWGSSLWLDRRRGISATFITDVQGFSEYAIDAALGLEEIVRNEVEAHQAKGLLTTVDDGMDELLWIPAAGSTATRVYALDEPIRDLFDLRQAVVVGEAVGGSASVAPLWPVTHYAVVAIFDGFENPAIVPGVNTRPGNAHCVEDLDGNGIVGQVDLVLLLGAWSTPGPGDVDRSGQVDAVDLAVLLAAWGPCG
ncbi:MAG: beta-lactamase family protein [Phycisphaerae bacterium]|nr:beta-lactamase family protein [Phycisphaerae bacterium]